MTKKQANPKRPWRKWTEKELEYFKKNYAHYSSVDMGKQLGRSIHSMYGKAYELGLIKKPGVRSLIAIDRENRKATLRDSKGWWISGASHETV